MTWLAIVCVCWVAAGLVWLLTTWHPDPKQRPKGWPMAALIAGPAIVLVVVVGGIATIVGALWREKT